MILGDRWMHHCCTGFRIQVLSFQEILDGKQLLYPRHRADATFKKAPRSRPPAAENLTLPLGPPEP